MKKGRFFSVMLILILTSALTPGLEGGKAQPDPADTVRKIELPAIDIELKDGAGRDRANLYCSICHSLDYITMQPGFSAERWKAITQKMINVHGAPINEEETRIIVDYLGKNYSPGK
jgi:hypothetical protein